jgi:hypothetical protein
MTARRSLMLAVFLTLAPFAGGPVVAATCDSCVLDFTGGSTFQPFTQDSTVGWKFTVNPDSSTITIGGLGIFDFGKDGLAESHQIGLWDTGATPTLLASATINNTNSTVVASSSSAGQWLFTPIKSSVDLTPGASYVVGAFYALNSADSFMKTTSAPTTISGVTFNEARASLTSGLQFPGSFTTEGGYGLFGPNLFIGAVPPVPEPETYAMLMAGLGLLSFIARRRRKSLNAAA